MGTRRELAARALGWITSRLPSFYMDEPGSERERIVKVTRLGELAMMAEALPAEDARAWLNLCWTELDLGMQIVAVLPAAPTLGCVYLPFRRAGLRSLDVERALRHPACRRNARTWHPFCRFALGVALEGVGVPTPWRQRALLEGMRLLDGPLGGADDPLRAEMLAHHVIWSTRMGHEPAALLDGDRQALARHLDTWCRLLAAGGEIDALGETLIAAACARLTAPASAWDAFSAAQRPDGSLPLRLATARLDFDASYHATLVAVVAGHVAEAACAPPPQLTSVAVDLNANFCD